MKRLLLLGGTGFLGEAVVQTAVSEGQAGGWSVTTFNRGLSGPDDPRIIALHGDRYEPDSVDMLARAGPWDVVIDCSGYVPRNVVSVAEALHSQTDRYLFMSSVSAYAGWPVESLTEESPLLAAPADAGPDFGTDTEDGPTRYGFQKAGCEAAVTAVFGARSVVLRPGVILGPREYVGRLVWWLRRAARGGVLVGPGSPQRRIQPVDVRDVARFAVLCAGEAGLSGAYNVTAPVGAYTFGELLDLVVTVTGSSAEVRWFSDDSLLVAGVRQWSEMPLWRTAKGVWAVDSSRAARDGLACLPLAETVADTWSWMQLGGFVDGRDRSHEIGMTSEREAEVLRRLAGVTSEPGPDLGG